MEGWQQSTKQVRDFAALPPKAQAYVKKIEKLVRTPVRWVSVGPGRDETICV
jgi:adenylosuccinate synthase